MHYKIWFGEEPEGSITPRQESAHVLRIHYSPKSFFPEHTREELKIYDTPVVVLPGFQHLDNRYWSAKTAAHNIDHTLGLPSLMWKYARAEVTASPVNLRSIRDLLLVGLSNPQLDIFRDESGK